MTAPAEDPRSGEALVNADGSLNIEATNRRIAAINALPHDALTARQQIPYMLENTREEFERVRDLAWPPPAAGRGDTDSGGEAEQNRISVARAIAWAFGNDWDWCTDGLKALYLADADRALTPARPAGDRAQPTEELREALKLWLYTHSTDSLPDLLADELLAGPLAALLDAQAKVERVEALAEDGGHEGWVSTRQIESALGGTA